MEKTNNDFPNPIDPTAVFQHYKIKKKSIGVGRKLRNRVIEVREEVNVLKWGEGRGSGENDPITKVSRFICFQL